MYLLTCRAYLLTCQFVQEVELNVVMHCEGCAGSVRKTLKKIPGTHSLSFLFCVHKLCARRVRLIKKRLPSSEHFNVLKIYKYSCLDIINEIPHLCGEKIKQRYYMRSLMHSNSIIRLSFPRNEKLDHGK